MIEFKKELRKHIFKVLISMGLFVFFIIQLEKFNGWIFTEGPEVIKTFFGDLGFFSIPIFIIMYVLANIFLTPSYPFVFISGMIYGLGGGTIISLIAEILSATTNFFIGRKIKKVRIMLSKNRAFGKCSVLAFSKFA